MSSRPKKRQRLESRSECKIEARLSWELIVSILALLPVEDLARCTRLSSYWYRLSNEPSLWRTLFIRKFAPKTRRRAALPEQRSRSWKDLYKIQQRWLDGKARSTAIDLRSTILERPPLQLGLDVQEAAAPPPSPLTIVRFSGQQVFVASRSEGPRGVLPEVEVHLNLPHGSKSLARLRSANLTIPARETVSVTEVALDEARQGRLAIFYSDGRFAIFDTTVEDEWQEVFASSKRGEAIALARLQSPLLVTCSSDFAVTFMSITEAKAPRARLSLDRVAAPMRTPLCWSPLVLSMRSYGEGTFRVNIAHSAPHFPGSWTVALHEFDLNLEAPVGQRVQARQVTAAPTSSALITAIEYRPPWLVASRADNTLDVWLTRSSPLGTPDATQLSLEHWRTLFGHTAAVHTVSLGAGGRCVSGGSDGRVNVWTLSDARAGAITVSSEEDGEPVPPPPMVSWLGFDDEKIIMLRSPTRFKEHEDHREDVRVLSFD